MMQLLGNYFKKFTQEVNTVSVAVKAFKLNAKFISMQTHL